MLYSTIKEIHKSNKKKKLKKLSCFKAITKTDDLFKLYSRKSLNT